MTDIRRARLKEWFADKTLPAKEKSYLSQLMTGKASFGEKAARRLEETYGMPAGYLDSDTAQGDRPIHSNVAYVAEYKPSTRYPLISNIQAGAWAEAIEPYTVDQIAEWYESDAHIQGEAFWLKVSGDSMTAPAGLSIPEGTLVLFDTGRDAINGSLVIAKLSDSNEATFKKLAVDGGQRYLKGLNPNWPIIPINGNCKIIGVAVETKMKLI